MILFACPPAGNSSIGQGIGHLSVISLTEIGFGIYGRRQRRHRHQQQQQQQ